MSDAYQINILRKRINKLERSNNDLSLKRNVLLEELCKKMDILISLFVSSKESNMDIESIKRLLESSSVGNNLNSFSKKSNILDEPVIHVPDIELGATSSKNVSVESKSIKKTSEDHDKIFDSIMER